MSTGAVIPDGATSFHRGQMKNARSFFFAITAYLTMMTAVSPGATFEATSGVTADLLLSAGQEAGRREHANKRLFGRPRRDTRRAGDGGQLGGDLRRVLTLHDGAHSGGRDETVDLRA